MNRLLPLALLALAAVLLSWNAGTGSILPSDDAIYAQAAREGLRDGRWLGATWLGHPLHEKGPVLHWALMASQAAFGEGEVALRLPGILAGAALLALLYAVARAAGLSRGGALAAAGAALAMNALYFNARRPMTDVPGAALGLAGFLLLAFGPARPGRSMAGGALLGLSAMAKLVAPAAFVLALLFLQADRGFRRPRALAWAALGGLLAVLPWHLAMTAAYGAGFWDTYLGYHLFQRAGTAVVGTGRADTYLQWAFDREGIAALLGGAGLLYAAFAWKRPAARVALALTAGGLIPLLASATALPHYLVALVPGSAVAAGLVLDDLARRDEERRPGTRSRRWRALLASALVGGGFLATNLPDLLAPDYGAGTRDACATLRARGELDRLAGTFDLHDPAVAWYCDRPVPFRIADAELAGRLRSIPMLGAAVVDSGPRDLRALADRGAILVTKRDAPLENLRALSGEAGVTLGVETFGARAAVRLAPR